MTHPPALSALLVRMPLAPLGPGTPMEEVRPGLEADNGTLFGRVSDTNASRACRAGLWLAFGFLDESHAISQELPTPERSLRTLVILSTLLSNDYQRRHLTAP